MTPPKAAQLIWILKTLAGILFVCRQQPALATTKTTTPELSCADYEQQNNETSVYYKTTITRNGNRDPNSSNRTMKVAGRPLAIDQAIVEKCATALNITTTSDGNCTEYCRKYCDPHKSLWWIDGRWKCVEDDFLVKNHECKYA